MVRSETPDPAGADQSLGDLVALAAKDVSQLLRYEIDLAKTELRADVKRVGLAGALAGLAAFVGCLVLILLCIAFADGLVALGIWTWAAFLIVAGTCVLMAALAVGIAFLAVRHLSGLRRTRKSVSESVEMLRGDGHEAPVGTTGERTSISRDGQQAGIAAREPQ
jgi:uncharacterized membrane protein YqjE